MKKLLIVESPTKARVFSKGGYLPSDFIVEASKGHIRDLPQHNLGIDIKAGFVPKYEISDKREKEIGVILKKAEKCNIVYLAPDPDREGEAIAWHIQEVISEKFPNIQFYRVKYNEINKRAVKEALESPVSLNMDMVNAQQARRLLDRMVGYKVSPLLWQWIKTGLSAGRVQSVGLRLICEREELITNFVPTDYWIIAANLEKGFVLKAKLVSINSVKIKDVEGTSTPGITDESLVNKIQHALKEADFEITETKKSQKQTKPGAPFITSTLQQAASSFLGFSASKTMKVAQELYEGIELESGLQGLITYMRTDSFNVSMESVDSCRKLIEEKFGKDFLPPKPNFFKDKKSSQGAHEAIRPVEVYIEPDAIKGRLTSDQYRLYGLIWKKFIASQMSPAINEIVTVDIQANTSDGKYGFRVVSSTEVFSGHRTVYSATDKHEDENYEGNLEKLILSLNKGDKLKLVGVDVEKKSTIPPPRFSEASLVKALEDNGVGRPSTYAAIISTLKDRKYVIVKDRSFVPTESGIKVTDFLRKNIDKLFKVDFTAKMEEELDDIEKGKLNWKSMLESFYSELDSILQGLKPPRADVDKLNCIIKAAQKIAVWREPYSIGKRKYDDKKFFGSVLKQIEKKEKEVSQKQLDSIIKILLNYTSQHPDIKDILQNCGVDVDVKGDSTSQEEKKGEPMDAKKLALLDSVVFENAGFDEKSFVDSLKAYIKSGRKLSPKQNAILDRIILKYASQIGGVEDVKSQLGLEVKEVAAKGDVTQIEAIVKDLDTVEDWKKSSKKGFDEKDFYKSLKSQFTTKGGLSPKQVFYLKKIHYRYFGKKDEK